MPSTRTLVAVAVLIAAVLGFGAWALYGSSWFRVEQVSARGLDKLTEDEVLDAAAVPTGEPLAGVDRAAVAARVREELRRVESVEVVRDWPKGVRIDVVERTPRVVMERPGGGWTEVDRTGLRYATTDKRPRGVPRLVVEPDRGVGGGRFDRHRLRAEAVVVAGDLPPEVRRRTEVIRVRSFDSIRLELSGNRVVMWGSSEYGAAKARALRALLAADKKRAGVGYFDVSVPSAPAVSGS
ncbi:cell division protein FtsQ/DivIB [Streptomyces alkaliterrae]|uniref:FtsQ-type POTRA domain-containing protein n=1 Tax=Streptomyces alkaliterrae TaxID=2213162 RepID=A0A5P0YLJ6_9ACTN|nr:FtsQ-type POTRA domain-containing protein [Streptomyces alkaliterrae]MBB1253422.1 FtsQ-type POTRA domain-containing protein [Streptomyces alkaliterrae]MBB1259948.1 FtsQ-type POTRA domain-containing protein [Streptomyces alkaliterrae]MQS00507.1 FtsQ-type POTRA domain-containing protein [Streptomyces alkaliterrae]